MPWPKRILLVRHAQSEGNVLTVEQQVSYPVADWKYDLTELGIRQAEATGRYLRASLPSPDAVLCSHARRAARTARICYPDAEIVEDVRLAELTFGIGHVLTWEEIDRQFPAEKERRERMGRFQYRPPGGENGPDLELRIHSLMQTLRDQWSGRSVVLFTHHHWLIHFCRIAERTSIAEAVEQYDTTAFANASVTEFVPDRRRDRSGRLRTVRKNHVPA